MRPLTSAELFLVRWLGAGPGELGECIGPTLDDVISLGLAELSEDRAWVVLTRTGVDVVEANGGPYDGTN